MFGSRRRAVLRRCGDNRIIAVIKAVHFNDGFSLLAAGIIACPLAERSFFLSLVRQHLGFDGDLCIRRNGQTGIFPLN